MSNSPRRNPERTSKPGSSSESGHVLIVSDNAQTLDGLKEYFHRAGVDARGTRGLERESFAGAALLAVVLFPDDFPQGDVDDMVRFLCEARPRVCSVLVTAHPKRFDPRIGAKATESEPIVLPKPAFGWTILDTIRARLDAQR